MKHKKYTATRKAGGRKRRKMQAVAEKKPVVGKALQRELLQFAEYHPVNRISRNLRTMLIDFLMYDGAIETSYLQDLLYDLQGLFELFEAIQLDSEVEAYLKI